MNIFGIVGWKNSGKTGLVTRLVSHFSNDGMRVATIKHAHHSFEIDHPGRDSYRHREAGASQVIVSSSERVAVMEELRGAPEPSLEELISRLKPCDMVIVEGYKSGGHPKIETHRAEARDRTLIARGDPTIRSIASDVALEYAPVPVMDLNDTEKIASFILAETLLVNL